MTDREKIIEKVFDYTYEEAVAQAERELAEKRKDD